MPASLEYFQQEREAGLYDGEWSFGKQSGRLSRKRSLLGWLRWFVFHYFSLFSYLCVLVGLWANLKKVLCHVLLFFTFQFHQICLSSVSKTMILTIFSHLEHLTLLCKSILQILKQNPSGRMNPSVKIHLKKHRKKST